MTKKNVLKKPSTPLEAFNARKKSRDEVIRVVVTSCNSNSKVHDRFYNNLKHNYCKNKNAVLAVLKLKNSIAPNYWWDDIIADDVLTSDILDKKVNVYCSKEMSPYCFNPLSNKALFGGNKWTVFGHPQVNVKAVATHMNHLPKKMFTTGSCNLPRYKETAVLCNADHHHIIGALVLEITNDFVFARHLIADSSGNFYDLDEFYQVTKKNNKFSYTATSNNRPVALICGDEHVINVDLEAYKATYGAGGLLGLLKPKYVVHHDVLDFFSASHHHSDNLPLLFFKYHTQTNDVSKELDNMFEYLRIITRNSDSNHIIVRSNHHDHFDKWLNTVDSRKDLVNADLIETMRVFQREDIRKGGDGHALRLYYELYWSHLIKLKFLSYKDDFFVKGCNLTHHGHIGVNGSKGSLLSFSYSNANMFVGHSHVSGIRFGVAQVGKKSKIANYEKGFSSHSLTDGILYPNGKKTLIDFYKGKYRA